MPWSYENPPAVAQNWTEEEIRSCVDAANAVLDEGGTDEEAIYACIAAAGRARHAGSAGLREEGRAMGRKTFKAPIVLKSDGEEGTFKSVFATLNVIDHDGDVIRPGAFEEGQEVVVEGWNHDYGLPPGKGVLHSDEEKAWIDGRFFLDTSSGRDHYLTLKNLEGLEEWSFTFDIEAAERGVHDGEEVRFLDRLDTWGVAPVTRGAGIDTRTVALKGAGRLTDEEVDALKAFLKEQDPAGLDGQGGSEGAHGEGEAGDPADPDGNPSGIAPGVVLAQVDVMELED